MPPLLIDVRKADEHQAGHLPNSHHIPHDEIAERIGQIATDKNTPIRLYCRSGKRADIALNTLCEMGYSDVQNLGGYEDLLAQTPNQPKP